ncbi:MAG: hypothetical protein GC134_00155 [Proteobacteria bacterium]|nr:hypothetical protein [Pseudomonadota bacterium]
MSNNFRNTSLAAQLKAAGAVAKVMSAAADEVTEAKNIAGQALVAAASFAEAVNIEVPAPRFDGLYQPDTAKREIAGKALNAYIRNYLGRVKNTVLKRELNAFDILSVDLIDKVLNTLARLHEGIAKAEAASKRNQLSIYTKVVRGRGGVDELLGKLAMSGDMEDILRAHARSALDRSRGRLKAKADEANATFIKADSDLAALAEKADSASLAKMGEAEATFNKAKKQVEVVAAAIKLLEDAENTDLVDKATRVVHAIYKMDVFAHHAKQRAKRIAEAKSKPVKAETEPKAEKAGKRRKRRRGGKKGKGGNAPAPQATETAPAVEEAAAEPVIVTGSCGNDCSTCPVAATCESVIEAPAADVPEAFANRADDYRAYVAEKGKAPANAGVLTRWVNARNKA